MSFREAQPRHRRLTDRMVRLSSAYCVLICVGPELADEIGLKGGGRVRLLHGEGIDQWKMQVIPCGSDTGYAVQPRNRNTKTLRIAFRRPHDFPIFDPFSPKVTAIAGGIELDYRAEKIRLERLQQREHGLVANFK